MGKNLRQSTIPKTELTYRIGKVFGVEIKFNRRKYVETRLKTSASKALE